MGLTSTQEQASFLELLCMTDDEEAAAASSSFLINCNSSEQRRPANGLRVKRSDSADSLQPERDHHGKSDIEEHSLQEAPATVQVQLQHEDRRHYHPYHHQQQQDYRSYKTYDHHRHQQQQQ
eukprot:c2734_g2_i1 orf=1-363(-)